MLLKRVWNELRIGHCCMLPVAHRTKWINLLSVLSVALMRLSRGIYTSEPLPRRLRWGYGVEEVFPLKLTQSLFVMVLL
ncbi:hypothetical protein ES708_22134 [subsurface metagenome]